MTDKLSADDVRGAVFTKSPMGKRGYDPKSVHELLQLAARRLDGRGYLDADHVRSATFRKAPLLQRGYDKAEVDAFVDRVAVAIQALEP
jgi:DivIVA domain-containing protein